jgi:hypothetical protein
MRVTRRNRIGAIIEVLEEQTRILESIGFAEAASLLRIAWLDLKRRTGSISIEELEAFCARISETVPNARHKISTKSEAVSSKTGRKKRVRPVAARSLRVRTPQGR